MKKVGYLLLFFLLGCAKSTVASRTLSVFAASSLTNAFTEIGEAFEAEHPGLTVQFNFAGSQVLRTQIMEGAQADVIAFASPEDMMRLVKDGMVEAGATRQVFASNNMILILPAGNPAQIHGFEDLARPGIKLVIAAEQVPAGRYARSVLSKLDRRYGAGFSQDILANVVSNEENVRQVVSKVQLGEADAGIVYASDAAAAPGLQKLAFPLEMNESTLYPIAVVTAASNSELAAEFIRYVLSEKGQLVLNKWGFLPPAE